MKTRLLGAFAALSLLLSSPLGLAADKPEASTELKDLVAKVQAKLQQGQKTEADLSDELKQFDVLLAEHKGEKTDDVAQILLMKAFLYLQVFDNTDKGTEFLQQLKHDFPGTKPGQSVDKILASIEKQKEAKKLQATLVEGSKFPDFDVKDLAGKPLAIANYKGKVLLIDFWATWCGPCVHELPNVIAAYEKHHGQGFEIIGISLDENEAKLKAFLKEKKMTWQQYFDGQGWSNKLATKYGIQSIPATYLLDGEGKIIGKDLRGEALDDALGKALAKK